MKKLFISILFVAGLLLLAYSIYVFFTIHGFGILNINSSTGMLYVTTYRYAAIAGIAICFVCCLVFFRNIKNKKNKDILK